MTMEEYIHDENLKLFRKVLTETTDDEKRARLIDLIRDEVAKKTLPNAKATQRTDVVSVNRCGPCNSSSTTETGEVRDEVRGNSEGRRCDGKSYGGAGEV